MQARARVRIMIRVRVRVRVRVMVIRLELCRAMVQLSEMQGHGAAESPSVTFSHSLLQPLRIHCVPCAA